MKARLGFVSNSSSSSFCILGFKVTDEIRSAAKKLVGDRDRDDDWDMFEALGVEYYSEAYNTHEDSLGTIAGLPLVGDESLLDVEERAKKLHEMFGEDVELRLMAGEYSC